MKTYYSVTLVRYSTDGKTGYEGGHSFIHAKPNLTTEGIRRMLMKQEVLRRGDLVARVEKMCYAR